MTTLAPLRLVGDCGSTLKNLRERSGACSRIYVITQRSSIASDRKLSTKLHIRPRKFYSHLLPPRYPSFT